jgi:hypothetical protein
MTKDEALKMAIKALEACKEALEQPQPRLFLDLSNSHGNHPVNKEWQGLTDDEISQLFVGHTAIDFARAIEQALKEKNHD